MRKQTPTSCLYPINLSQFVEKWLLCYKFLEVYMSRSKRSISIITLIGIALTGLVAPSHSQVTNSEQRMIEHCQQKHPELSVDQCRSMYQNMKNMTPEQRVERCKRNHPELSAEACQKKYGGST